MATQINLSRFSQKNRAKFDLIKSIRPVMNHGTTKVSHLRRSAFFEAD